MDSDVVPPPEKRKKLNPPPSFLSLPDVIIQHCLARIPRSYYPKLCLVCKTFRALVSSLDLSRARLQHETREVFFHVCLQFPDRPLPSWFTLWIKPDQISTKEFTGNTLLVPVSTSYFPSIPPFTVTAGLKVYILKQNSDPSPVMLVGNKGISSWRQAPNMKVARANAIGAVLDEKIYVMGGCGADESTNWAEVFDTKTQTWESLPEPGGELRNSSIRRIQVQQAGNLKVITNGKKDYAYDPKEGKWEVVQQNRVQCNVGDLLLRCDPTYLEWYDTKSKEWRVVKGLYVLNKIPRSGMIEKTEYHGKLLLLWDKFEYRGRRPNKNIWCAVIALERCNGDEIRGEIKWANIVLKVPRSYRFLRSLLSRA